MTVRQSLLAILDQGPCYGNQLRAEFDRRTGSLWPLNVGQIYNTLDRLERDGLVTKGTIDADGQIHYSITAAGHAEVGSWLGSPVVRPVATRDELAIKVAVAATLPGVDAAGLIRTQLAESRKRLRDGAVDDRAEGDVASAEGIARLLMAESMRFAAEAEVLWLEYAGALLDRAAASGFARPVPLNTDTPKRGRPNRHSGA